MDLTINKLLHEGLVNYKQKVVIEHDGIKSEMKYLKDQPEAIDKDYHVIYLEAKYCKETDTSYLFVVCE